ncbi:hypothetical protein AVEN_60063-1 [Araneus ventricosus]|uniref:HAT C-terminal dimerisation domain-containing protein n=1 Tax=Araneus ventricosus TaxID=182803 RepID=A0A4Y2UM45_ARAVE|nr:hypothetical protein AVEN_38233-1 [Araneus ventricosus]GBO12736.1 hypothetical protein AVEN_60063-1 [Araneus ventricosus]
MKTAATSARAKYMQYLESERSKEKTETKQLKRKALGKDQDSKPSTGDRFSVQSFLDVLNEKASLCVEPCCTAPTEAHLVQDKEIQVQINSNTETVYCAVPERCPTPPASAFDDILPSNTELKSGELFTQTIDDKPHTETVECKSNQTASLFSDFASFEHFQEVIKESFANIDRPTTSRNSIITRNYKYFPNLEKNINDLDIHEKPGEETVAEEFISVIDSSINEFSARFSHFKELPETLKFIMYPDVTSFDKLNLSQFDWLKIEEFEMQLIDFQSSSTWIQKFIETRKELELIEIERLTSNISKNANHKILETWNLLPDTFNCLKKLARAILTIFSSTYACESLFSDMNNIKDSLRNRLTDDSSSACILLKVTSYNPNISCHLICNNRSHTNVTLI